MTINFKPFYLLGLAVLLASSTCNSSSQENTENKDTTANAAMSAPAETINAADTPKPAPVVKDDTVLMKTDKGDITLIVYGATPKHKENFVKLCKEGFYNGLLFHRVIKDFMIQGGDPNSKNAKPGEMLGAGDIGYTIPAEFVPSLRHKRGALAAARTENPEKRSSGCQFYICHKDANFLDQNYTVFGEVIKGIEIVDAIATTATDRADRPTKDIHIISTKVLSK